MAMTPAADFIATLLDMTRRPDDFTKEDFAKQLQLAARVLAEFIAPEEKAQLDLSGLDESA